MTNMGSRIKFCKRLGEFYSAADSSPQHILLILYSLCGLEIGYSGVDNGQQLICNHPADYFIHLT